MRHAWNKEVTGFNQRAFVKVDAGKRKSSMWDT